LHILTNVLFLLLPLLRPTTALILPTLNAEANFHTLSRSHPRLIVLFTNPSDTSPSLQSFQTIFEQAAESSAIPFLVFDCGNGKDVCQDQDVNAYPAVRLFMWDDEEEGHREEGERDGIAGREMGAEEVESEDAQGKADLRVVRYRGKKTVRGLRSFAVRHSLPQLSHISRDSDSNTVEELNRFKKIDDMVVVAYLHATTTTAEEQNPSLLEVFQEVAEDQYTDFVFGYVDDPDIAQKEGITIPSIMCYKNTDGDHKSLTGVFMQENVESLLEDCSKDIISEFQEKNIDEYMIKTKLALYIFAANEDDAIIVRRELTPLAKKYESYVKMGVADAYEYGPMAKNFGLADETWPAVAVHAPMNDNVFVYRQGKKIGVKEVEAMLMTILKGKAANGQVFGEDEDDVSNKGENGNGHDEL
jgi:protein disulfide-isomerase A1